MGMFRDLKEGFGAAKAGLDQVQTLQQQAAMGAAYTGGLTGIAGTARIDGLTDTGTVIDEAPVMELDLTVSIPGREPYKARHRQLVSHATVGRFQPGAVISVRVSPQDPAQLMLG